MNFLPCLGLGHPLEGVHSKTANPSSDVNRVFTNPSGLKSPSLINTALMRREWYPGKKWNDDEPTGEELKCRTGKM
jgi:hypothetical protein